MYCFPLSPHGAFPDWLPVLEFSFTTDQPKTAAPIAVLRIVPRGFECEASRGDDCDAARVVYGIYVDAFLEIEPNFSSPWHGDFLDPVQLRAVARLIADPADNPAEVIVRGEVMEFKFTAQVDGRINLVGHLGQEGWGAAYLDKRFQDYPFQSDLRFKCGLSQQSLKNTLDDLQKLLSVVDEIEAGRTPTLYES